jgi:hypothetical protein
MSTRFYFHLVNGKQRIIDRVGMRLPLKVVTSAGVMDKVRERWPGTDDLEYWETWSVEIVDAEGHTVCTLTLF